MDLSVGTSGHQRKAITHVQKLGQLEVHKQQHTADVSTLYLLPVRCPVIDISEVTWQMAAT